MAFHIHYANSSVSIGSYPNLNQFGLPFASVENSIKGAVILGALPDDIYVIKENDTVAFESEGYRRHIARSLEQVRSPVWLKAKCLEAGEHFACLGFSFADIKVTYGARSVSGDKGDELTGTFTLTGTTGQQYRGELGSYVNRSGARQYRAFEREFQVACQIWNELEAHRRPLPGHAHLLDQILEALPQIEEYFVKNLAVTTPLKLMTSCLPELRIVKQTAVRLVYGQKGVTAYLAGAPESIGAALAGELPTFAATLQQVIDDSRLHGFDQSALLAWLTAEYGDAAAIAAAAWRERGLATYRAAKTYFPQLSFSGENVINYGAVAATESVLPDFICASISLKEVEAVAMAHLLAPPLTEVWRRTRGEMKELLWRSPELQVLLNRSAQQTGSQAWKLEQYNRLATKTATMSILSGKSILADCTLAYLASGIIAPQPRFRVVNQDGTIQPSVINPDNYLSSAGARLRRRFCDDYVNTFGADGGTMLDWMCELSAGLKAEIDSIGQTARQETAEEILQRLARPVAVFLRSIAGSRGPGHGHYCGCRNDLELTKRVLAAGSWPAEISRAAQHFGCDCRVAGLYQNESDVVSSLGSGSKNQ